ncbi:carbohydrate ABC transporter permease, partial [Paenibacillus sp. MCAF20]
MLTRRKYGDVLFNVLNYTFFAVFTIICIFPFYYLFINTISSNDLSSRGLVTFYPKMIHLTNYVEVLQVKGLSQAALVSVGRTVVGTLLTVVA